MILVLFAYGITVLAQGCWIWDTVSLVQSPVKSVRKALLNVMGFASSLRSTVPLSAFRNEGLFFISLYHLF